MKAEWLIYNSDLAYVAGSFVFLQLAIICLKLDKQSNKPAGWRYLALSATAAVIVHVLQLLSLSILPQNIALPLAGSFLLLHLSILAGYALQYTRYKTWVRIILPSLSIVSLTIFWQISLAVSLIVACSAVLLIFILAFRKGCTHNLATARIWLLLTSYVALQALIAAVLPGAGAKLFLAGTLLSVLIIGCLTIILGSVYHQNEQQLSPVQSHSKRPALWLAAVLAGLFIAGWPAVGWMGKREDVRQRQILLDVTRDMVKTLDLYQVRELSGSYKDLHTPAYKRIKLSLQILHKNVPQSRFVYLMGIRNGTIRFLADSELSGSPHESPPGQVYHEASPEMLSVFADRECIVEGPVRDRWGEWISTAVPVLDPESRRLIGVLGMDIDAASYQSALFAERLKAIVLLYIALLSVHAVWGLRMRFLETVISSRDLQNVDPVLRWGSPAVVGIAVLAVSLVVMCDARRVSLDSFQRAFRQNGAIRVEAISETIRSSLEELESFSRFYKYSDDVTAAEFMHYATETHTASSGLETIEWIPQIPAHMLAQHELTAKKEGHSSYQVWQKDSDGSREPVTPRNYYYPVLRMTRSEDNDKVLGYDLGSEQIRNAALQQAIVEKRTVATAPLRLVQERADQNGFLVFVPVYTSSYRGQNGQNFEGFILGVYRAGDLVNLALRNQPAVGLNLDIYDVGINDRPVLLNRFKSQTLAYNPPLLDSKHAYYQMMEVAGRYWQVKVTPETAFLRSHYSKAYLWILPFGLQLALLAALLTERLVTGRLRADLIVKKRTREVVAERERLNVLLRSIGDGVIATDVTGRIVFMNRVAEGLVGWTEHESVGRPFDDVFVIINEKTKAPVPNPVSYAILTGNNVELARQTVLIARDGSERLIADSASPVKDASGEITGGILVFRDVTEEQARVSELNERDAFQQTLLENLPAGVVIVDAENHTIESVNPSAARMFGALPSEILGKHCHQFLCSAEVGNCPITDQEQTLENSDRILIRADGSRLPILKSVKRIRIKGRDKLLEMFVDITERKRAEDELSYKSSHDSLTGLYNRQHFEQALNHLIQPLPDGSKDPLVVAFIDLDKFKLINDTLGHKVGDQLLMEVSERLQLCLRENDVLARMGGDEFTLILSNVRFRSRAEMIASRIIESLSSPFEIQGARFVIGASIGLAQYPGDGKDVVTLLRHADAAMYKAKQAGRSTFRWYTGDVDRDNQSRVEIENDIRAAIDTGQFQVYYQPIISLATGEIVAAESLLRWDHPLKGMISPSLFIPIAEETGLIRQIGDGVLRTACTQLSLWKQKGLNLKKISVNISTAQVRSDTWLDSIQNALQDSEITANELVLELTESDFAIDYSALKYTLQQVQDMGIGVAIDDFGMGYSSLSRIKDFALIHLKIDGSFVRNIEHNDSDKALLHSIIDMAHGQNMQVTAEWVETQSQVDLLKSNGCDFAQGYFISPPLNATDFEVLLRNYRPGQKAA